VGECAHCWCRITNRLIESHTRSLITQAGSKQRAADRVAMALANDLWGTRSGAQKEREDHGNK
jgi:hypothetical protein